LAKIVPGTEIFNIWNIFPLVVVSGAGSFPETKCPIISSQYCVIQSVPKSPVTLANCQTQYGTNYLHAWADLVSVGAQQNPKAKFLVSGTSCLVWKKLNDITKAGGQDPHLLPKLYRFTIDILFSSMPTKIWGHAFVNTQCLFWYEVSNGGRVNMI